MKIKKELNNKNRLKFPNTLPLYCDFNCKYANFSPPETAGACRKEISVWCNYYKKFNNKHNKCISDS